MEEMTDEEKITNLQYDEEHHFCAADDMIDPQYLLHMNYCRNTDNKEDAKGDRTKGHVEKVCRAHWLLYRALTDTRHRIQQE
jgi:hypothetical protein